MQVTMFTRRAPSRLYNVDFDGTVTALEEPFAKEKSVAFPGDRAYVPELDDELPNEEEEEEMAESSYWFCDSDSLGGRKYC